MRGKIVRRSRWCGDRPGGIEHQGDKIQIGNVELRFISLVYLFTLLSKTTSLVHCVGVDVNL